jgi:hypothetical protein
MKTERRSLLTLTTPHCDTGQTPFLRRRKQLFMEWAKNPPGEHVLVAKMRQQLRSPFDWKRISHCN